MFFTWNHQTLVRTSSDNWTKAHSLCWNYFWRKNLTVSRNEITSVYVFFTKFLHSFFVFIIFLDDESRQKRDNNKFLAGRLRSGWLAGLEDKESLEDLTTEVERALNMCHSCVSVLVLICGGSQHYLPLCLSQGSHSAAGMWKYTEFLEVALWGQSIKTFSQNNFLGMMLF